MILIMILSTTLVISGLSVTFQNLLENRSATLALLAEEFFILSVLCLITGIATRIATHNKANADIVGLIMLVASIVNIYRHIAVICWGLLFVGVVVYAHSFYVLYRQESKKFADKLSSDMKERFLTTLAHDVRTPLSSVLGMNEAILKESTEENILSYATDVDTAGKILMSLINDTLDYAKLKAGKTKLNETEYKVKDVVSFCYNMEAQKARKKNLKFTVNVDENTPSVLYGDPTRVQQIAFNLLANSVKYTDKGEIEFCIGYETRKADEILLTITVKDTGKGMDEEKIREMFATKRKGEEDFDTAYGSGLGIPITMKLVKLMHGTISVNSKPDEGTVFVIKLPQKVVSAAPVEQVAVDIPAAEEEVKPQDNGFRAPNVNMLVVDDVKLNLKVVNSLLKKSEMKIDNALSGEECLEMTHTKKYDIILLDHMMPGKDGIVTLWEIRRDKENLNHNTPVIMMTANAGSGAKEEYMGIGFSDYISKPFNLAQLQYLVKKHVLEKTTE